jgi:hypothetical protein
MAQLRQHGTVDKPPLPHPRDRRLHDLHRRFNEDIKVLPALRKSAFERQPSSAKDSWTDSITSVPSDRLTPTFAGIKITL